MHNNDIERLIINEYTRELLLLVEYARPTGALHVAVRDLRLAVDRAIEARKLVPTLQQRRQRGKLTLRPKMVLEIERRWRALPAPGAAACRRCWSTVRPNVLPRCSTSGRS
jgi:hypothetical protein